MATHHASPGEIVDLASWTKDLPHEASKAIIKTEEMELARLLISPDELFPDNPLPGPVILHCLSGSVELRSQGTAQSLSSGQLIYLQTLEPNSINAKSVSVVLMTVVFNKH